MTENMPKPSVLIMGALALIAAGGAGSMLGVTIEPQSTTELRVERAQLAERVISLESRVELLEGIVNDCQAVIAASRTRLED